jgi:tRNA (guanine-N(7)-)-methyltransferase subunit TRM82
MPKRPCAIALTSDESTILCADKFGDVYSLPLLGFPYEPTSNVSADSPTRADAEEAPEPFVPAANSKTVHTKKNQEALRNQLRTTNKKPEKNSPQFDHQLLLGHVSLLTDVASVTITDETSSSPRPRSYILTADRDEHIRVSRGIPQTYVIEGYCLGHTEFVSKLCVPDWNKRTLISGGGDDFLLIWDWPTGTVRQKVDLKGPLEAFKVDFVASLHQPGSMVPVPDTCHADGEPFMEKLETKGPVDTFRNEYLASEGSAGTDCLNIDGEERKIAVSGIWALKNTTPSPSHPGHIFVALEA